jgi:signal transduction histidine kinase
LNSITRHDILNSIQIALPYLSILKESSGNKEHAQFLKKIEDSVLAIQKQIEFTGTLQNLGNQVPRWQNVHELFMKAKDPHRQGIIYKSEVRGLELYADSLLGNVFFALIDNSIRHGEKVTEVSLCYHKPESGLILIYRDNGIGIEAPDKKNIFRRGFGRNTGLGLFLVKEILSLTGMTIQENGEPQKGARFEIIVPEEGFRVRPKKFPEGDGFR